MAGHEARCAPAELFPLTYSRKMIEGIYGFGILLPFHLFHRVKCVEQLTCQICESTCLSKLEIIRNSNNRIYHTAPDKRLWDRKP
jgi:hypothetical protein